MRFLLLAIQMAVLALPALAEDPFSRFVGVAQMARLRAGETLTASVPADGRLSLIPTIGSGPGIAAEAAAMHPTLGVELLRVLSTPSGAATPADPAARWLSIYNILHAASTMQGITYWSVSKGRRQVLFTQSYAVAAQKKPSRIPDPSFMLIPREDTLLTFQEDHSFGRNLYRETFAYRDDHLSVKVENLTAVSVLLIPIIQPGNLVSRVIVVPAGNDILFYGASFLRSAAPLGDRRTREESLSNRLTAMADWLQASLGGAAPSAAASATPAAPATP
jgi:hypothetical protein